MRAAQPPPVIVTFALLTGSILSLWVPRAGGPARFAPFLLFAASLVAALSAGIVTITGLGWIAAFVASVVSCARASNRWHRAAAASAVLVLAGALMAHQLPGFNNPRVISDVRFTPDALPFRLHLNFDKTLAGFFLVALLHPCLTRAADWRGMITRAAPVSAATLVALLTLSMATGYVRFAPKWPPETWLFFWANLCFTCFAEEALFRGFIQAQLTVAWRRLRHGAALALVTAALLFGLAHAGGGAAYVALSTIAGVGYGWAYLRSGQRLEASILTHFALNAVHFVGFTYPALQRA